jgi:hypothetical protein
MDLLSIIYRLPTDPRAARRQIIDWMMSVLTHGRFSEEFFDAARASLRAAAGAMRFFQKSSALNSRRMWA